MSGKILCTYPAFGINGVQRFVKDLYEEFSRDYEVKLAGVWFDERLEVYKPNSNVPTIRRAINDEGDYSTREKIKKDFISLLYSYEPDILHLNTCGMDIEVLKNIYNYRRNTQQTRIVYTAHSLSFQDFSRNPEYRKIFNIDNEHHPLVRELVEISGDIFSQQQHGRKIELLRKLLTKYNIPIDEERLRILEIISYVISLQNTLLKISDCVIFVSEFLANSAYNNPYVARLINGKSKVIRNGTRMYEIYENNRNFIKGKAEKWRREYDFEDKFIVGYFGRITESKGVIDLIDVIRDIVRDGYKDVVLVMGGPMDEGLEGKIVKEYEDILASNLFFFEEEQLPKPLSPTGDIEVALIHSVFDVEVYPSYYETFGLVPLEAVSCMTPTIVRRIDNLVEFEKDGIVRGFSDKEELKFLVLEERLRRKIFGEKKKKRGSHKKDGDCEKKV